MPSAGSQLTNGYPSIQYTLYLVVFFMLLAVSIWRKLWQMFRPRRPTVAQSPATIVRSDEHELESVRPPPGLADPARLPDSLSIMELERVVVHRVPGIYVGVAPASTLPTFHTSRRQTIVTASPLQNNNISHGEHLDLEAATSLDQNSSSSILADIANAIINDDDGGTLDVVI